MLKPIRKSFRAIIALFALAGAVSLLAGCTTPPGTDAGTGAASADADIVAAVHERLEMDPVTRRQAIGVRCSDGVVKLSGAIRNPQVRARALGIVNNTPGVKEVVDNTVNY